jgi:predicted Zn-dependent peptidase|uniref:Peptidase M16 N-terminal domain-containing protein n=1 Tax=viral metagenome TaxID=1070528 RepID=A0A6C0IM88_9ZZZZ
MKIIELPNGLKIIYEKASSDLSITSIYALCNLGPIHEPDDMRGISHLIEHMCFKGTKNKPNPKSIFLLCDKIGAYFNAYTSKRYTCYTIDCDDKYSLKCLHHLSDMMLHSIFDEKEFTKELHIVAQENIDDENDPLEVAENEINRLVFKGTAYEHPIDHVDYHKKKIDYNKCCELYKQFYTPNNMIISVVSNLPFTQIQKYIKSSYFNTKRTNHLSNVPQMNHQLMPQKDIQYQLTKKMGVSNSSIMIGFRICGYEDKNKHLLNLIKQAIGQTMSGRLKHILREEKALVYSTYIDTQFYEKFGSLTFVAQTETKNVIISNTSGVLPIIIRIINDLINTGLTVQEINNAKGNIQGDKLLELQSVSNQAQHNVEEVLFNENLKNVIEFKNIFESCYKNINKPQVHKIIKQYFKAKNMSVCIVGDTIPSIEKVKKICSHIRS